MVACLGHNLHTLKYLVVHGHIHVFRRNMKYLYLDAYHNNQICINRHICLLTMYMFFNIQEQQDSLPLKVIPSQVLCSLALSTVLMMTVHY